MENIFFVSGQKKAEKVVVAMPATACGHRLYHLSRHQRSGSGSRRIAPQQISAPAITALRRNPSKTKENLFDGDIWGSIFILISLKHQPVTIATIIHIIVRLFFTKETVTMTYLKKNLGEAISVKDLAEFLKINEKTLRENYRQFGGIKIGRHYRFFTKEVAKYALEKRQKQIYSAGQEERSATGEGVSKIEPSKKVGSRDEKADRRGVEREDKHGLLVD
jgi:hypothetical protein